MVLTLYKRDTSAPCRSVFMVLEALQIKDVEFININTQKKEHLTEEYLKMNPQHTVPTLKDGDFVIWDSQTIATYLVNKYAEDSSLYPKDPQKRALVDLRLHFNNGILFTALRETMVPLLYQGAKSYKPESLEKIKSGYDFIETFLTKPWLTGNDITLADICCVGTISTLNLIVPIDSKIYPKLSDWLARCSQQEFYIKGNLNHLETFRDVIKSILG